MHLVDFSLLNWKKKKENLLERILLNAISNKNSCHKQSAFLKSELSGSVCSELRSSRDFFSQQHGVILTPRRRRAPLCTRGSLKQPPDTPSLRPLGENRPACSAQHLPRQVGRDGLW